MKAYHFTGNTLRNGDPIPPIGEWLVYDGPIVPCKSGLHASEHPFDALQYAPGNILHLVELDGELVGHGSPVDKWVGRRRKIIQTVDVEQVIEVFAKWCALQVVHLWDAPKVVVDFLKGDESKRAAAWAAAQDAAWAAAWAAASDAASDAAWAAARAAAWAAAQDAARAAAWAAAWAAASDAAQDAQRSKFKEMVEELFEK